MRFVELHVHRLAEDDAWAEEGRSGSRWGAARRRGAAGSRSSSHRAWPALPASSPAHLAPRSDAHEELDPPRPRRRGDGRARPLFASALGSQQRRRRLEEDQQRPRVALEGRAPHGQRLHERQVDQGLREGSSRRRRPDVRAEGASLCPLVLGLEKLFNSKLTLVLAPQINFTALGADAGGCSARTYPLTPGEGETPFQLCFADGPTGTSTFLCMSSRRMRDEAQRNARASSLAEESSRARSSSARADGSALPAGLNSRYSTQFPAQVTTAATWDMDLIHARAVALAKEYAAVGGSHPLSIVVGPLGRSPYGGRNWEGFTADPYLSGEAVRVTVEGFQDQGIVGLVKCVLVSPSRS